MPRLPNRSKNADCGLTTATVRRQRLDGGQREPLQPGDVVGQPPLVAAAPACGSMPAQSGPRSSIAAWSRVAEGHRLPLVGCWCACRRRRREQVRGRARGRRSVRVVQQRGADLYGGRAGGQEARASIGGADAADADDRASGSAACTSAHAAQREPAGSPAPLSPAGAAVGHRGRAARCRPRPRRRRRRATARALSTTRTTSVRSLASTGTPRGRSRRTAATTLAAWNGSRTSKTPVARRRATDRFTSTAATPGGRPSRRASSAYSASELPAIETTTRVPCWASHGSSVARNASRPGFWQPDGVDQAARRLDDPRRRRRRPRVEGDASG